MSFLTGTFFSSTSFSVSHFCISLSLKTASTSCAVGLQLPFFWTTLRRSALLSCLKEVGISLGRTRLLNMSNEKTQGPFHKSILLRISWIHQLNSKVSLFFFVEPVQQEFGRPSVVAHSSWSSTLQRRVRRDVSWFGDRAREWFYSCLLPLPGRTGCEHCSEEEGEGKLACEKKAKYSVAFKKKKKNK